MYYRIRYSVHRIEAGSPKEAKQKAVAMLKANAENLITIETVRDDRSVLRRLFFG